VKVIVIIQVW